MRTHVADPCAPVCGGLHAVVLNARAKRVQPHFTIKPHATSGLLSMPLPLPLFLFSCSQQLWKLVPYHATMKTASSPPSLPVLPNTTRGALIFTRPSPPARSPLSPDVVHPLPCPHYLPPLMVCLAVYLIAILVSIVCMFVMFANVAWLICRDRCPPLVFVTIRATM